MRVYEFRKNLKAALDAALRGEEVLVERSGVTFRLVADVVINPKAGLKGAGDDKTKLGN